MWARTAPAALAEGTRARPDAVLLEREMPDLGGAELCRFVRGAAGIDATMPIVVTTVNDLDADQRLELLRAGAWDVMRSPADPDEVVTRVETYLAAKRAAERAREAGLVDPLATVVASSQHMSAAPRPPFRGVDATHGRRPSRSAEHGQMARNIGNDTPIRAAEVLPRRWFDYCINAATSPVGRAETA